MMIETDSSSDEEEEPENVDTKSLVNQTSVLQRSAGSKSSLKSDINSNFKPSIQHKRNPSYDSVGSGSSPRLSQRISIGGKFKNPKINNADNVSLISHSFSEAGNNETFHYMEDNEHKKHLQLYVFVSRCIAYPFNAKQPTDMARRQSKVTKQNLTAIKDRFYSFLEGKTNIIADEAFRYAVQDYFDSFLSCDRVHKMVNSGGYSSNDFREIFKANIEKRVRSLPDIEGLSKETVLSSWMGKFDAIYRGEEDQKKTPTRLAATAASELILSKEQLYEMFQTILTVKQHEHSILFNACQLDNADEQAACIRRELNKRQTDLNSLSKENMPKFIHKNMEEIYIEEQKINIKKLMSIHLEAFPVTKGGSDLKTGLIKKKERPQNNVMSIMDVTDESQANLAKSVSGLSFNLQVTVMEASGLETLPQNRIVFVVMELEGDSKLQTEQAEAGRPVWETQGEWTTSQPLPLLKLRLMAEHSSKLHLSDEKEIAILQKYPHCGMSEAYSWHTMTPYKGWNGGDIKLKISIKMEKHSNIKKSGYLYARGQSNWKTWKKRYFMLIQVDQYKFVLCSYREKRTSPKEVMVVEGYTADFADKPMSEHEGEGARFFFNMVKAGDEVIFATDEDVDRLNWIYKLCTATGQSFRPALPSKMGGTTDQNLQKVKGDMDRALKHGLYDIVQADPFEFNQAEMFKTLQRLTLLHRLNDSYTCLGWFSPGQVFVLDEYCARYGVRGCHRNLCYLSDLLERALSGIMIDPTLLHYSFAFCHAHVVGNRPDGVNTVTIDEKERFEEIKDRLKAYLANQITHFRYCFPFGRPEGALKSTLTLFERVLSKDLMPSADPEDTDDVKEAIRACLRKAALVNYTRLSSYAKVQESFQEDISPKEKLKIVIHLAELCIELIQQNEEHHAEALAWYNELMLEHTEIFWCLFAVDMDAALDCQPPDTWDGFALFQMLNDYLRMESPLRNGKFHQHLSEKFAPLVVRYVDFMGSSIARSVDKGFAKETYQPVQRGCATSEEIFWKLRSIQTFIQDLHWPDEDFAEHMSNRLKLMARDMTEATISRVIKDFRQIIGGSVDVTYVIPHEACVIMNVICHAGEQAEILCKTDNPSMHEHHYHANIEELIRESQEECVQLVVQKCGIVLQDLLRKLTRYDHGTLSSKIFSLLKPNENVADEFLNFMDFNIREMRAHLLCDNFTFFMEKSLWEKVCELLQAWLSVRQEVALHVYQFKVLSNVLEPCRNLFEDEGLTAQDLENDDYKIAYQKLQLEEAMLNLSETTRLTREIEVRGYQSQIQDSGSDYYND